MRATPSTPSGPSRSDSRANTASPTSVMAAPAPAAASRTADVAADEGRAGEHLVHPDPGAERPGELPPTLDEEPAGPVPFPALAEAQGVLDPGVGGAGDHPAMVGAPVPGPALPALLGGAEPALLVEEDLPHPAPQHRPGCGSATRRAGPRGPAGGTRPRPAGGCPRRRFPRRRPAHRRTRGRPAAACRRRSPAGPAWDRGRPAAPRSRARSRPAGPRSAR